MLWTHEAQPSTVACYCRLARVGFWEASQGSEGFLEGSLDVLLTSVGAAVIKGAFLWSDLDQDQ